MIDATVELWKQQGKRIVFTNGCFDILHAGHVELLNYAKSFGDKLIVGLNSDASVTKLKGPERPIMEAACRYSVLISLRAVDYVHVFDEPTPANLVKTIRPDVLVKGEDYKNKPVAGAETVLSYGGKIIYYPFQRKTSTTHLINKIREVPDGPSERAARFSLHS